MTDVYFQIAWCPSKPDYRSGPVITDPVSKVATPVLRALRTAIERELEERDRLKRVLADHE